MDEMTFEEHAAAITAAREKLEQTIRDAHKDRIIVEFVSTCNPANTSGTRYITLKLAKFL